MVKWSIAQVTTYVRFVIRFRTNESRVREKLESMTRSSNASKMLSDAIVTIRNDRFVIPVKQEYRGIMVGLFMINLLQVKRYLSNHKQSFN